MSINPAAAVAIETMVELDTDIAETLLEMLTSEEEPVGRHYPLLAALVAALDETGFAAVHQMVDLCPIHRCDDAICADDDDPECAHLRADPAEEG